MKILVSDDNLKFVEEMINLLEEVKVDSFPQEIVGISDEGKLLDDLERTRYDIAYLDFEFGDMSGNDIARMILEKNPQCLIIFVSSFYRYVYDAFNLSVFHFIHKPVDKEIFRNVYYKAIHKYQNSNRMYYFNTSQGKVAFNPRDIMYLETCYENVKIITDKRSYYSNVKNVKMMKDILCEYDFEQVHQSFYLNFNYIKFVLKDHIVLINEEEIPISARNSQKVMERFNKFLSRKHKC